MPHFFLRTPARLFFPLCLFLLFAHICFCAVPLAAAAAPAKQAALPQASQASLIPSISIEQMAGQMIMSGFRATGEDDPPERRQELERVLNAVRAGRLGGVILFNKDHLTGQFGRNITNPKQLMSLTAGLQKAARQSPLSAPLFIGLDEEGGRVQRLRPENGFSDDIAPALLGLFPPQASYQAGLSMGRELAANGINLDFAPGVDLSRNPSSPAIGALGRSFGPDAATVVPRAEAFAGGLAQSGILISLKHFPGHGSAGTDTHLGLADITETWSEEELAPYKALQFSSAAGASGLTCKNPAGNARGGAAKKHTPERSPASGFGEKGFTGMVMVGHLTHRGLDPDYPASLSGRMINGILRGLPGRKDVVVITDDMEMKAVSKRYPLEERMQSAINAGVDIFLCGNNLEHNPATPDILYQTLLQLVKSGGVSKERVRESYARIMRLKAELPR